MLNKLHNESAVYTRESESERERVRKEIERRLVKLMLDVLTTATRSENLIFILWKFSDIVRARFLNTSYLDSRE